MAEKLQSLLDKINEKGVKEAEATAAGIIAEAKKEAEAIRATPRRRSGRPKNRPKASKNGPRRQSARPRATSSSSSGRSLKNV